MKKFVKMLCVVLSVSILATALAGCGGTRTTSGEDPNKVPEDSYEINWYFMGEPQNDTAAVESKINEYLKDKINATVKLNRLPSSQYSKKLTAMISAGEYFDIAFTANWMLSYASTASNGAFYALDDNLDKYMPETKKIVGEDIFNNARVNGKIYGVPALKEMASQIGVCYRKDIADKYNIDMTKVKTIEDLEEVLKFVQSKEPDMTYPIDWAYNDKKPNSLERFVPVAASCGFEWVDKENDVYSNKVVHTAFSQGIEEAYYTARRFYEEGLVKKDVLTAKDFDQRLKSGKVFAYIEQLKPGKAEELSRNFNFPLEQIALTPSSMDITAGTGSMSSISITSKNPERVMRFLELVNTDKYLNNLIVFGIEGKHYTKIDDKFISVNKNGGYTLSDSPWMMGNVFLNYLTEGEDPEKVEKLQEFNATAKKHDFYGFVFDPSPVQQQIAAVTAVDKEYGSQVSCGAMPIEPTFTEYRNKLKQAGVQDVIDEIQRQYDKFLEEKNKK